ncbi:MAG TPA: phosphatidate cytidylyltransferase [Trueperaceae bacterium]|nr:phosphatidate cytidylyltransferase [Trueperaceae bacterium]
MSNLSKRIISAFLAFTSSLVIIWVGLPLMAPAYLFVSIVALREFSAMMNVRKIPIRRRSLIVATVLTLPASLPVSYPGMQPLIAGVSWREALVGLFIFYLISLEVIKPNQNSLYTVVFSFFAYMYIPWLLGYTITLRYTPDGVLGFYYLLLPLLAIIASDVGAYSFGRIFGKRALAPRISPNKTLEGAFGGLGFAIFVVALTMWGLEHFLHLSIDIYDTILFSILVASASQLGDLFESLIKRWAGVKDSGDVMPGHGGVLDRIDSLLFAVPVTYYFMALIILR